MTETPQRIRAVAQVGAAPAARSGPGTLLPRPRPGHLGALHLVQLLLVETAVVAVVAAIGHGTLAVAAAGTVAFCLTAAVLARSHGRWWLERWLMRRQYRRRRRSRVSQRPDPRVTALRALTPRLAIDDVPVADGAQVGVARDDAGWYAVAVVTPTAAMRDDPIAGLPVDALLVTLTDAGQPGAVLQVVTHTVPAPGLAVDPSSAAGQSYRQMLGQFHLESVAVDQATWLAVRLDARALAEAGADDAAEVDKAPAVVATLVRRVAKTLRHHGVPYQILDAEGLVAALARSADLGVNPETGQPAAPREEWKAWHSAWLAHRTYWLRDWPPLTHAGPLLSAISRIPASLTSISLILAAEADDALVDLRGLVRIAAPPAALAGVCQTLERTAEQAGAKLFPLDGEHGPAVYATAPTGGGPR